MIPRGPEQRSVFGLPQITPSTVTFTSRLPWSPPPVAGRAVDRPPVSQPPPPRYSLLPGALWLAFPQHTDALTVGAGEQPYTQRAGNVCDRVVSLCHPEPLRVKVPCIPWRVLAWFWIRLGRIRLDERHP